MSKTALQNMVRFLCRPSEEEQQSISNDIPPEILRKALQEEHEARYLIRALT